MLRGAGWGLLAGVATALVIYAVAWCGMHLLDQPDIFWIVRGIEL